MRAFVGDGGEVRTYIKDQQGKVYGISRTLSCTRTGRSINAKWQIEGSPNVFLLWNNEFRRESDLTVEKVFHLEVYPQGEVVKIKDNVTQQMRIVDALAKVEYSLQELSTEEVNGERTIRGELIGNSQMMISKSDRLNELTKDISGVTQLQGEIGELEKLTSSPLFAQKKNWSETEIKMDEYGKELLRLSENWSSTSLLPALEADNTGKEISELAPAETQSAFNPNKASSNQYLDQAQRIFTAATITAKINVSNTQKKVNDAIEALSNLEIARKSREEGVDAKIRKKLQAEDEGTEESGLIDRITEKRRRLNDLLQKQREHESIKAELENIIRERESLLKRFYEKWDLIREARREIVHAIDSESATNIKAELIENADRNQYLQLLDNIADRLTSAANRIQNKDAQLDAIVSNSTPNQLIDIVKEGNSNRLIEVAPGVTLNTARIIMSMGQADINNLEECVLDDKFVISYQKNGNKGFTPIDSGLSGGEQALALISVAMIPKQLPLVIDQPEDELGPALITHELVEQIRSVKSSRQLIFVTHIPNIPVLADSEQIIYVEQNHTDMGNTSEIKCCGSLDQNDIVEHLLELDGGDIAFQKRNERYAAIMRKGK